MTMNKFAIVFPGQGSQAVGMLADVASEFSEISAVFNEASQVLGYDLQAMAFNGPADELNKTVHTQPALLAASYALYKVLQSKQMEPPAMLAGHSLGEYTALVCANALSFSDAIKLVAARGQYMQEAVAEGVGAMAAIIGLDEDQVKAVCEEAREAQEVLAPANYNSVGQIVIAGHHAAVLRAMELAKSKGAKMAVQIPVSVPSHCELMRPAAERLANLLQTITISPPTIPVLSNVDVAVYADAAGIRDGLTRQLFSPVRWVETIKTMIQHDITRIIECGPGKVLTGLNKRIDKTLNLQAVGDLASLQTTMNEGSI